MSIVGYFEKPRPEPREARTEAEKRLRERETDYYRSVEDYDPVLRAHCRVEEKRP
jgi:hypothetical protein